jgi:hypothetical protein
LKRAGIDGVMLALGYCTQVALAMPMALAMA